MSDNNGKKILNKKQQIAATTILVGTAVTAVYLRRKYNLKIEEARDAGVSDWIKEIHDDGLTMLVLTKELADRLFVQMNTAIKEGDYAFQPFEK